MTTRLQAGAAIISLIILTFKSSIVSIRAEDDYSDKEEISGKKDENFQGQNDRNDYNDKKVINRKKNENSTI